MTVYTVRHRNDPSFLVIGFDRDKAKAAAIDSVPGIDTYDLMIDAIETIDSPTIHVVLRETGFGEVSRVAGVLTDLRNAEKLDWGCFREDQKPTIQTLVVDAPKEQL